MSVKSKSVVSIFCLTSGQFNPPFPAPNGGMATDFTLFFMRKRRKS